MPDTAKKRIFTPVRTVFLLLTAACMVLIFCFSMDNADDSSDKSGRIVTAVVHFFVSDFDTLPEQEQNEIIDKTTHIVRKLAHFTEFAALGFCASCTVGKRKLLTLGTAGTVAFCFLYACTDEFHQYFVPGRACRFTDVLIDTSGSCTGMLLSLLCLYLVTRRAESATH
jgi:VanZ family protein